MPCLGQKPERQTEETNSLVYCYRACSGARLCSSKSYIPPLSLLVVQLSAIASSPLVSVLGGEMRGKHIQEERKAFHNFLVVTMELHMLLRTKTTEKKRGLARPRDRTSDSAALFIFPHTFSPPLTSCASLAAFWHHPHHAPGHCPMRHGSVTSTARCSSRLSIC